MVAAQVAVTKAGVASVLVGCTQSVCSGSVALEATLTPALASAGAKPKKLILGRRAFRLRAGQRKAVRIKLNRAGLKLLRQRKRLRARAIVTVRGGKRSVRVVTLIAARRR